VQHYWVDCANKDYIYERICFICASVKKNFFSRRKLRAYCIFLSLFLLGILACHGWRSFLYPVRWTPPESWSFTSDKLIQDFSYAGYRRGEKPLPFVSGPVFDVVATYGGDPTGNSDSTAAIQSAIDAAVAVGGGVVWLPPGTYRVAPSNGRDFALQITASNIVLRGAGVGQTYILNDSYEMRNKAVIRVESNSISYARFTQITDDLDNPTRRIPVDDSSAVEVGDILRIDWAFTQDWIDEHGQGEWWNAPDSAPRPAEYHREVLAVNSDAGWIEIDIPTRYTMRVRDNARLRTIRGQLSGVGIEDFSIGNVQHPGTEWGEEDYDLPERAAYEAHASHLIAMAHAYDSWITRVESFQAPGNTTNSHMLSNGIRLVRCFRVTLANCVMQRSQYGGGGGNGYMIRIQQSQENLIKDSTTAFSRHGFVVSHEGASGNVFLRCLDRETARSMGSVGSLGYETGSSGSDHHQRFSHSNLFDQCHAYNSYFTAIHRADAGGETGHALTSAHGVYWNTGSSGRRSGPIVRSEQGRYGYVIGTSGSRSEATNPTRHNTSPADILEGIGLGETLEPPSLYQDQLTRRLQGIKIFVPPETAIAPSSAHALEASVYNYGLTPLSYQWSQLSGPVAVFSDTTSLQTTVELVSNGNHVFELQVRGGDKLATEQVFVTVDDSIRTAMLASVDSIIGRRQENAAMLGYMSNSNREVVGTRGSFTDSTREDGNVILSYALPALPAGHRLDQIKLQFEITHYRNHSGADPGLDVYLLATDAPQDTGTDFFFHGKNDSNPKTFLVGGTNLNAPRGDGVSYPPGNHVEIYTLSEAALGALQDFYGEDHLPEQTKAFFRLNLDNLYSRNGDGDIDGARLDHYRINIDSDATSLTLFSNSRPNSFDSWVASFDLNSSQQSFTDDPDNDNIPNGLEAWFGTHPGEYSTGITRVGSDSLNTTFTHPRAQSPPTDMIGLYQWSPNLIVWYSADGVDGPSNGVSVSIAVEDAGEIINVTATSSSVFDRLFLRLSAREN